MDDLRTSPSYQYFLAKARAETYVQVTAQNAAQGAARATAVASQLLLSLPKPTSKYLF